MLYSLRDVNAGLIQIVLDMCNSGLLIDAANGLSPNRYGPPISQFLSKNQKLSIYTAAARDQASNFATRAQKNITGSILYGDATDLGGWFTQIFVAKMWHVKNSFGSVIKGGDVDVDLDGLITKQEYDLTSARAMRETKSEFSVLVANQLGGGNQTPQSVEIVGTGP